MSFVQSITNSPGGGRNALPNVTQAGGLSIRFDDSPNRTVNIDGRLELTLLAGRTQFIPQPPGLSVGWDGQTLTVNGEAVDFSKLEAPAEAVEGVAPQDPVAELRAQFNIPESVTLRGSPDDVVIEPGARFEEGSTIEFRRDSQNRPMLIDADTTIRAGATVIGGELRGADVYGTSVQSNLSGSTLEAGFTLASSNATGSVIRADVSSSNLTGATVAGSVRDSNLTGATVGAGARISSSNLTNAQVESGARVADSNVTNAVVHANANVRDSNITVDVGEGAQVRDSNLRGGSVIGAGAVIQDCSDIYGTIVGDGATLSRCELYNQTVPAGATTSDVHMAPPPGVRPANGGSSSSVNIIRGSNNVVIDSLGDGDVVVNMGGGTTTVRTFNVTGLSLGDLTSVTSLGGSLDQIIQAALQQGRRS